MNHCLLGQLEEHVGELEEGWRMEKIVFFKVKTQLLSVSLLLYVQTPLVEIADMEISALGAKTIWPFTKRWITWT